MDDGYKLKANTYGVIKVERGIPKVDEIKVAICPTCGEMSMYLDKGAKK
jgi:hypothetical protein